MNNTFFPIKNQACQRKIEETLDGLSNATISVLNVLLYVARKYKDVYLSQETIAARAGIDERTVRKVLHKLRSTGLADWYYRGYKKTCLYKVNSLFSLVHIQQMVAHTLSSLRFIPLAMLYLGTSLGICQPELGRLYKKKRDIVSLSSLPLVYFKTTSECSNTSGRKRDSASTGTLTFTSTKGEKVMKTLDSLNFSSEQRQELSQFSETVLDKALVRLQKANYVQPANYFRYLMATAIGINAEPNSNGRNSYGSSVRNRNPTTDESSLKQKSMRERNAATCENPFQLPGESDEAFLARLSAVLETDLHPIQKDIHEKMIVRMKTKLRLDIIVPEEKKEIPSNGKIGYDHPLLELGSRVQESDEVFLAKIERKLQDPTLLPLTRELNRKMAVILQERINATKIKSAVIDLPSQSSVLDNPNSE